MITNYDKVEYLNASGNVIHSSKLIYSDTLKNDFLAMMLGQFSHRDAVAQVSDKLMGEYSDATIEVLSTYGTYSLAGEGTDHDHAYYSYVGQSKMCALRLPIECTYLKLIDSSSGNYDVINLINGDYAVNASDKVEKLVILSLAPQSVSNVSPGIHEHSLHPHSNISDKVLTTESLNGTASLIELTDDLYDNVGMIKLGDYLEPVIGIIEDQAAYINTSSLKLTIY